MDRDDYAHLVALHKELIVREKDLTALTVDLGNSLFNSVGPHQHWMPVFEKLADARHALQDAKNSFTNLLDLEASR